MTRAVILDRDGVINDHRRFVNTKDDFFLFPETPEAIRLLNQSGFLVLVATNQGGVGLGYMTEENLAQIHEYMLSRLHEEGGRIDDIAVCPHAPSAGCDCRKPKPGLLLELWYRHHFDLEHSYMVGDRETDVQAGKAAGTKTVLIGPETSAASSSESTRAPRHGTKFGPGKGPGKKTSAADFVATNILDAARWIVQDAVVPQQS